MSDFKMPVPSGVMITKGDWYHDNWITPELDFTFLAHSEKIGFTLTFWNPDFSMVLLDNSLLISLSGQMKRIDGIKLGQTVSVDVLSDTPLSGATPLRLQVQNSLPANRADARERGIIMTRFDWL